MKNVIKSGIAALILCAAGHAQYTLSNGLRVDASGKILISMAGGAANIVTSFGFPLDSSGNVLVDCAVGCSSGAVSSVFGRSGAVAATSGDYTVAQVTGAVSTSTTVNGHALSSNVTVSASDITTGTLPLAQSFPGVINGTDGSGTANVYTVTLSPVPSSYVPSQTFGCFVPHANNTNATPTGQFNGLGTKTIVKFNGSSLTSADMITTEPACLLYDGTNLLLLNPMARTGGGSIAGSSNPTFSGATALSDNNFGSLQTNSVNGCESSFGISTLTAAYTTGLNCLPANSVIDSVVYRITTTITGTTTSFTIGDGSTAGRFCVAQSTLTSGTTGICTVQWTSATAGTMGQAAAAAVKFTANGTITAGAMRLIVYYHTWTAPTS